MEHVTLHIYAPPVPAPSWTVESLFSRCAAAAAAHTAYLRGNLANQSGRPTPSIVRGIDCDTDIGWK